MHPVRTFQLDKPHPKFNSPQDFEVALQQVGRCGYHDSCDFGRDATGTRRCRFYVRTYMHQGQLNTQRGDAYPVNKPQTAQAASL